MIALFSINNWNHRNLQKIVVGCTICIAPTYGESFFSRYGRFVGETNGLNWFREFERFLEGQYSHVIVVKSTRIVLGMHPNCCDIPIFFLFFVRLKVELTEGKEELVGCCVHQAVSSCDNPKLIINTGTADMVSSVDWWYLIYRNNERVSVFLGCIPVDNFGSFLYSCGCIFSQFELDWNGQICRKALHI